LHGNNTEVNALLWRIDDKKRLDQWNHNPNQVLLDIVRQERHRRGNGINKAFFIATNIQEAAISNAS